MRSLMLKLLAVLAILSSSLVANEEYKKVEDFILKAYEHSQNLASLKVKVLDTMDVQNHSGWIAYVVQMDVIMAKDQRQVVQKMLWFSDGDIISKEVFSIDSKKDLNEFVTFKFSDEYYKKENLIYGSEKSRHKVVIFSDPLCPFCRQVVPEALKYMKKDPAKYAVYYYHLPLENLHPVSVEIVQAAIALELKGEKDVALKMYDIKVNPNEKSNDLVIGIFNKTMNSKITMVDLLDKDVNQRLKEDLEVADKLLVNGTPTMFVDGEIDRTKTKYKEVK